MTSVTSSSHIVSAASTQAVPAASKQSSTSTLPNVKVFDKEPSKDFTGMVPAFFEHIAKLPDGSVVGCVKLLNASSLKSKSLIELIKSGDLAAVLYDHGAIKMVSLDSSRVEILVKQNASKIYLSTGGKEFFPQNDVDVDNLSPEYYNRMAKLFFPLLKKV